MRKLFFLLYFVIFAFVAFIFSYEPFSKPVFASGASVQANGSTLSASSKISTTAPLAAALATQGNPFVTGLTGWTDSGSQWSFNSANNGEALHASGGSPDTLTSGVAVVSGQSYLLTYSVAYTSGTGVTLSAGAVSDTQRASSATFTMYFTATATTALVLTPTANFAGAVYNVTLQAKGPVVTSCGTGPTVQVGSSNVAGYIAVGSGAPTACTVTFSTAFTNIPACFITAIGSTAISNSLSSLSNSAFTAKLSATDTGLTYICVGLNE